MSSESAADSSIVGLDEDLPVTLHSECVHSPRPVPIFLLPYRLILTPAPPQHLPRH